MKIDIEKIINKTLYGNLKHGDTFICDKDVYMRINTCYEYNYCDDLNFINIDCSIRLKDGFAKQFSIIQEVQPIDLKVVNA